MILVIDRNKPFGMAPFIGPEMTIWRGPADGNGLEGDEQQDPDSLALKEVDFRKARFETGLAEGRMLVTGEKRLIRLREKGYILPDVKIGQTLCEEPGRATLEWLYQTYGVVWFELPGTVLRSSDGYRCFLCLYREDGGLWLRGYIWLCSFRSARMRRRHADGPALVLAK